jgi:hypothetical protein
MHISSRASDSDFFLARLGSAISIYGIEVINPANISFTMDDPATKTFHYFDTRGGFVYNALFFEAT